MPATELLPVGTGASSSAEFAVAAGETVTICLKGAQAFAAVQIELKTDAGGWEAIGVISERDGKAVAVAAPGTYRVTRIQRPFDSACGVFRA